MQACSCAKCVTDLWLTLRRTRSDTSQHAYVPACAEHQSSSTECQGSNRCSIVVGTTADLECFRLLQHLFTGCHSNYSFCATGKQRGILNMCRYKGVYHLSTGLFRAAIGSEGRVYALGHYHTDAEAARAYDHARIFLVWANMGCLIAWHMCQDILLAVSHRRTL